MKKALSSSFRDSIKDDFSSCVSELVEVGLDAALEDGLVKDIPIVSLFVAAYKIGESVRDRHNVLKLAAFIDSINSGASSIEEKRKYRECFNSDETMRNRELEYILIVLDKYIGFDKPRKLAMLYAAYLEEHITWEVFGRFAEMVDRFLPGDLDVLEKIYHTEKSDNKVTFASKLSGFEQEALLRLSSMGLVDVVDEPRVVGETLVMSVEDNRYYALTNSGMMIMQILAH